jgi:hypothetical protein
MWSSIGAAANSGRLDAKYPYLELPLLAGNSGCSPFASPPKMWLNVSGANDPVWHRKQPPECCVYVSIVELATLVAPACPPGGAVPAVVQVAPIRK